MAAACIHLLSEDPPTLEACAPMPSVHRATGGQRSRPGPTWEGAILEDNMSTVMAPEAWMTAAEAEPAVATPAALVEAGHFQPLIAGWPASAIDDAYTPVQGQ